MALSEDGGKGDTHLLTKLSIVEGDDDEDYSF